MNTAPSSWLTRWPQALRAGARALDLACGSGRNFRYLAEQGLIVTGVDHDAQALQGLSALGEVLEADLEAGPWPLEGRQFDLVLVCNYLWRPRLQQVLDCVAPGGWLVYETFATGQQTIGRPSRPEFLLQPGELIELCAGLRVVGFEDGFCSSDPATGVGERYVQRIAAVREIPAEGAFARYFLKEPHA